MLAQASKLGDMIRPGASSSAPGAPLAPMSPKAGYGSAAAVSEGVMVAMASEDPLDKADFDPIAHLNHLFPTERSLDRCVCVCAMSIAVCK
jgi:hypothetical protein